MLFSLVTNPSGHGAGPPLEQLVPFGVRWNAPVVVGKPVDDGISSDINVQ